jgi:single-stranded DNA-binding protein
MRQITLDGRIGTGGAKTLQTAKGKSYIRFSLANDSFVNGALKTEWFDITCFDPFLVENKAKFMTQGRYVIVQGIPDSVVTNKDGKIYLNHYVTANNIELPSFGGKREESNEVQVSTFTGGTKSAEVKSKPAPVQETYQASAPAPQPQVSVSQAAPAGWSDGDDLPF